MAECVVLNADGTLTATGQPVDQCAGYVLASSIEHGQMNFLGDLFANPGVEVLNSVLVASFGFVLVCNVVGSIVGSVVKAVSTERH